MSGGHAREQPPPTPLGARPQEQAAAGQHAELVADDLGRVATAELFGREAIYRQAVERDVLRGGQQIESEDGGEEQTEPLWNGYERRREGGEDERRVSSPRKPMLVTLAL